MKTIAKFLLTLALLAAGTCVASAQKFGIINSQELLMLMPELDSVQIKMQAFNQEMQNQLETIQVEYNQKLERYQAGQATMTASVRQISEKELTDLSARFQEFQVIARQDQERMQGELMQPIVERAQAAIEKVGKAGGYTFVLDESSMPVVYHDAGTVIDLLPAVKTELGIPADAQPRLQQQAAQ